MGDYGYRESVMFGFDLFFLTKVKVVIPRFIIFRMMWRLGMPYLLTFIRMVL